LSKCKNQKTELAKRTRKMIMRCQRGTGTWMTRILYCYTLAGTRARCFGKLGIWVGFKQVLELFFNGSQAVTGTWGRKPASSSLPMDQGKSWEPAHHLELKCRKYCSHSRGSLHGQSTSRIATLERCGKAWGSRRSPSR